MSLLHLFKKKQSINDAEAIEKWQKEGCPAPPPHAIKRQTIEAYRQQYQLKVLVETGTYMGDMVAACKDKFDTVYSIELSEKLYRKAVKRFANDKNVHIVCGDSATKLSEILSTLSQPCLFWLDGHYSGGVTAKGNVECPVIDELHAIYQHRNDHLILIDDARLFNGTHDYPTIEQIEKIIAVYNILYNIRIENDIIRIIKNQA
jgi:hypothetical protein